MIMAILEQNKGQKVGVLLVNLGSPDAPTAEAVKPYLKQFLSDRRVVDLPALVWQPILRGIILRKRPPRSAALYKKIWLDEGAPLTVYSLAIQTSLQAWANAQQLDCCVELGMTYGNPSLVSALQKLIQAGVDRVVLLPLFPQYSTTTTAAVDDAYMLAAHELKCKLPMSLIGDYHDQSLHIDALAASVLAHASQQKQVNHLLISFHGTPEATRKKGDPYYQQCVQTAALLVQKLGLKDTDYSVCFQSRFGYQPWLQPYTDDTLTQLAQQGHQQVDVICPGFAVDCLETLEEVAIGFAQHFKAAGGQSLNYIPALNQARAQIDALGELLQAQVDCFAALAETG
jgi:ferrochelatase